MGSYSVPEFRLPLSIEPHCSPGYFQDATWVKGKIAQLFSVSVLDQANNPRRLVGDYGDSDASSYAYSCSTVLDGIHCWVQCYRLLLPLHGLIVSLYRGEHASPLHLGDRNLTYTELKLSETFGSKSLIPDAMRHF